MQKKTKTEGPTQYTAVPWDELDKQWLEEVRAFVLSLDYAEGEKMFNGYYKERKAYDSKSDSIMKRWRHLHNAGNRNEILADKLREESELSIEDYRKKIKKIFGRHYGEIQQFYKDFEASIQAHSREPNYPIGVDIGFANLYD